MHKITILALAGALVGLPMASAAAAPKNLVQAVIPAVTRIANPAVPSASLTSATNARLVASTAEVPITRLASAKTAASAVEAPIVDAASTSVARPAGEEAPNPALDTSRGQAAVVALGSTKKMTSLAAFKATAHEHDARLPAAMRRVQRTR